MKMVPINWWAVLGAVVWNMVIGFLWYGPVFGKVWKSALGLTDEAMKSMKMSPAAATIGGVITAFLMSYVLAHATVFAGTFMLMGGGKSGLMSGFWNWLGFAVPLSAGAVLWEGKPWKLFFINAGYWLVALLGMGAIIGHWSRIIVG